MGYKPCFLGVPPAPKKDESSFYNLCFLKNFMIFSGQSILESLNFELSGGLMLRPLILYSSVL